MPDIRSVIFQIFSIPASCSLILSQTQKESLILMTKLYFVTEWSLMSDMNLATCLVLSSYQLKCFLKVGPIIVFSAFSSLLPNFVLLSFQAVINQTWLVGWHYKAVQSWSLVMTILYLQLFPHTCGHVIHRLKPFQESNYKVDSDLCLWNSTIDDILHYLTFTI